MQQICAEIGDLRSYINRLLPHVTKPARYIGGEYNSIKKDLNRVSLRFALAFPDIYEVGMSNLGLRIIYHALNEIEDIAAERVFAPWNDMEVRMREARLPLYSLETFTPLCKFDIVGFSLPHELVYTNVLNMLDMGGIPLLSSERSENDPIVLAGGHCAFNPEPMADFVDAFAIGDGEELAVEIAQTVIKCKSMKREQKLLEIAKIPGVYVPRFYQPKYQNGRFANLTPISVSVPSKISKRIIQDLDSSPFPLKPVVSFIESVHDRAMLEIARGCTRGCRFCQAGMICRPVRERSKNLLIRQAEQIINNTGCDEIGLISLSSADYSDINSLVRDLIDRFEPKRVGVSMPSLRADAECVSLAEEIERIRKTGLTFALEAGSQRLRDIINKNVTENDLLSAVGAALDKGWRRVKLYFMIGLPGETDEDVIAIADLIRSVLNLAKEKHRPLTINASIACFVPKPHTPFQWRAQDSVEELQRKIRMLQNAIRHKSVKLGWHPPIQSRLECILARGDRRLGKAILFAWRKGAKFDNWDEYFHYQFWEQAFDEAGLDVSIYTDGILNREEPLPWDHIDIGVSKDYLAEQDEIADLEKADPDCRIVGCKSCGLAETEGLNLNGSLCAEIRKR